MCPPDRDRNDGLNGQAPSYMNDWFEHLYSRGFTTAVEKTFNKPFAKLSANQFNQDLCRSFIEGFVM